MGATIIVWVTGVPAIGGADGVGGAETIGGGGGAPEAPGPKVAWHI